MLLECKISSDDMQAKAYHWKFVTIFVAHFKPCYKWQLSEQPCIPTVYHI